MKKRFEKLTHFYERLRIWLTKLSFSASRAAYMDRATPVVPYYPLFNKLI